MGRTRTDRTRTGGTRIARRLACAAAALVAVRAGAQLPLSLDRVPVPKPANLARFVKDEAAAIRLGKALYWDVQLGSDGRTACATCHFHAGTDDRTRNTLHPGADGRFAPGARANADLAAADFPFLRFADPDDRATGAKPGRDDVVGAQGVPKARYRETVAGRADDRGVALRDGLFGHAARNVRQVTGRNAPSVINAVFNVTNFWDGRAHPRFNGVNPFGVMDPEAHVLVATASGLEPLELTGADALDNASLASQAVGPPGNEVEMSWAGRSWKDIGRKMLALQPLAKQAVHPADGVFRGWVAPGGKGLATTYPDLVRAAFAERFWSSPATTADGFSLMEANFSLFFGLAVQLYESTLVSDDTPFDRFLRGNVQALSEQQLRGMNLFFSAGTSCAFCHAGPELTAASYSELFAPGEPGFIEVMAMADGGLAAYDIGFYNIGVRLCGDHRTQPPEPCEDPGRAGRVTLGDLDMPLSFTGQWLERERLPYAPITVAGKVAQPGCVNDPFSDPPNVCPLSPETVTRQAVRGSFKVPGLRNVELTGPYMHNGGMATLSQVVEFYVRGGDFHDENLANLAPIVTGVTGLKGAEAAARKADLVAFLLALTDERVRWERAPFDHPQLFVADGHLLRIDGNPKRTRALADRIREIPAVGALGRQAQGLPPLKPFLARDLEGPALTEFHFQH